MFRTTMLVGSLVLSVACGWVSQSDPTASAKPAALPELRAPLSELRTWFDTHRDEARFIAILSPT